MNGAKKQGPQSEAGPAQTYREALAALDRYCRAELSGQERSPICPTTTRTRCSKVSRARRSKLDGVDGKAFFEQAVKDVQMGFFADPIYGGNRDMVAWKMIGYPGARYNYLDWVDRHNERFPLPPVSMTGRAEWTPNR